MRILCLTSRLPYPPDRGDRLRAFHFIEQLSQEHELQLLSFIAHESERDHLECLREFCVQVRVIHKSALHSALSVALNLWRPEPLQALYYRSGSMQRLVDETLSQYLFDAAYIHLFRMAPFLAKHNDLYRIVDLTDVISEEISRSLTYRGPVSRLVYSRERPRIRRYEHYVADHFEETWLISKADREILYSTSPDANIQVVRNGVDLAAFRPLKLEREPNSLVFVGHMGVFHNIDAATYLVQEILPLVRQEIPDCHLKIVGADPSTQVEALGDNEAVEVTGFVPDLNEALNRSAVFCAPLRFAAGVQNKVLEAMAASIPVVTTSLTNSGVGALPGRDLIVADETEAIAAHVVSLLRDQKLGMEIGQAGRQFIERNYSWHHVVERMRAIERKLETGTGFPSGENML